MYTCTPTPMGREKVGGGVRMFSSVRVHRSGGGGVGQLGLALPYVPCPDFFNFSGLESRMRAFWGEIASNSE